MCRVPSPRRRGRARPSRSARARSGPGLAARPQGASPTLYDLKLFAVNRASGGSRSERTGPTRRLLPAVGADQRRADLAMQIVAVVAVGQDDVARLLLRIPLEHAPEPGVGAVVPERFVGRVTVADRHAERVVH